MGTQALDLDARRRARAGKPKELVVGGTTYKLAASLPLRFGEDLLAGRFAEALVALAGEDGASALLDAGLDVDDLTDICSELYGLTPPESRASSPSSRSTGGRARQRSKPRTG